MAENRRCPRCGKVIAGDLHGLCPECLLQTAMHGSGSAEAATIAHDGGIIEQAPVNGVELPQVGQVFGGYRIIRPLGRGGMGAVFEADHLDSGRRLALKVLSHSLDSTEARQRFLREGRLAASVNHPNNVYIFGTEEINAMPVISMELVPGGTLKDRIQNQGPLPVHHAVDAVLQVINGLEAAHRAGVLHRDVKPSNCFVDGDGFVKIGDFGLSISTVARTEPHLTVSGVFLGTPTFASPEQLRGDELDQRSDIYALGVTLFYLLTGKVPFEADNMVRLVATVLEKPAPSPRTLRPDIPAGLAAVIVKCLEKQPGNRPKTYADLRQALLPFSSFVPAPLPLRFVAGFVDFVAIFLVTSMPVLVLMSLGLADIDQYMSHAFTWDLFGWSLVFNLGILLVYYAIPERIWGASFGKWLCRLRVADLQRQPPGVARAMVRAVIYMVTPTLPMLIYFNANNDLAALSKNLGIALVAIFSYYPILGLLFITCRRHNGNAAIHDLLTGVRVILRPAVAVRPALSAAAAPVTETSGTEKIGPYHVLEIMQGRTDWLLAYDARLLRKVWIRRLPAGAPEVPAEQRSLTRAGRLRWLGGHRSAVENWDAFEAPTGQALWHLLDQPQPWSQVRFWLMDLADELGQALKDGSMPDALGLDRIWLTGDGRAKLLDFPAPGVGASPAPTAANKTDVELARRFLHQVAIACLEGKRLTTEEVGATSIQRPLPLHARVFLDGLCRVQRPEVAAAQLQSLVTKPSVVTPGRRWALVALCVAAPLLAALFNVPGQLMLRRAKEQVPQAQELRATLNVYAPVFGSKHLKPEQYAALETYIGYNLRSVITDKATWNNFYVQNRILPAQREAAERIVAQPKPTEAEAKQAAKVVETLLKTNVIIDVFEEHHLVTFALMIFGGTLIMYVVLPSLVCALIFRGGLLWAILGVTAVTNRGGKASRLRVFWRNLIAWSPVLLFPFALALLTPLAGVVGPSVILVTIVAGLVIWSTSLPGRGLPDRLAGTWLVMR